MRSINDVTLAGTVGRDPEFTTMASGTRKAVFSMVTNESWKDKKTGEWKDEATWHSCECWGLRAEGVDKYIKKGCYVFVRGHIQKHEWTKPDGTKAWMTSIRVADFYVLRDPKAPAPANPEPTDTKYEDDIPF